MVPRSPIMRRPRASSPLFCFRPARAPAAPGGAPGRTWLHGAPASSWSAGRPASSCQARPRQAQGPPRYPAGEALCARRSSPLGSCTAGRPSRDSAIDALGGRSTGGGLCAVTPGRTWRSSGRDGASGPAAPPAGLGPSIRPGRGLCLRAAARATVILQIDGHRAAGPRQRSATTRPASVARPIRAGPTGGVSGDGFADTVQDTRGPLQGPMRSQLTEAGLRVDWMTPGGGVQSTILIH